MTSRNDQTFVWRRFFVAFISLVISFCKYFISRDLFIVIQQAQERGAALPALYVNWRDGEAEAGERDGRQVGASRVRGCFDHRQ